MSRDFIKILSATCGLTFVAILLVVSMYAVRAWTVPRPIAVRYVPPMPEEPPDNPNLSDDDKRLLEQYQATIHTAKREIDGLYGDISATGGAPDALKSIDMQIADWELKKKTAEGEVARIRSGRMMR